MNYPRVGFNADGGYPDNMTKQDLIRAGIERDPKAWCECGHNEDEHSNNACTECDCKEYDHTEDE